MSFTHFKLDPAILKAIDESGYTTPSPIQAKAIPVILAGRDLIASAQTGTGKTAAFILPALQHILTSPSKHGKPRVLILTPTRELAQQVTDSASKYGKHMRFTAASIVGGMPYRQQFRQLSRPLDMLIATPGRLMDIMERPGSLDLSHVEFFILDEADRMLDMGFIEDVEHIAMNLAKASKFKKRQTLLFSATLDSRIGKLAKNLLDNPETIEITPPKTSHTQIEQRFYIADDVSHKNKLLDHILENEHIHQAIIFSATKRHADNFAKHLRERGHQAVAMHGDMKQVQRNRTLDQLRQGKIQFLVATDVAARGIDVRGISHVINYDLPRTGEDYTHRIGRTGRAGEKGIAITFALSSEFRTVQQIERTLGTALPLLTIPGLEPRAGFRKGGPSTSTKSFGKRKFGKPSNPRFARGGGNSGAPSRFGKSDSKPDFAHKRRDSDSSSFNKPRRSEGGNSSRFAKSDRPAGKPDFARGKPRRSSEGGNSSRFAKPDYAAGKPDFAHKRRDSEGGNSSRFAKSDRTAARPDYAKKRQGSEGGNTSRFAKPDYAAGKPDYAKKRRESTGGNSTGGDYVRRSAPATAGALPKLGLKKKKLGTKPTAHKAKRKKSED